MKIVIQYPSGKLEIFKNVTNVEDARKHPDKRNVGLIFETRNGAIHRRDFKEIKAFQIVGSNNFNTVMERGLCD